MPLDSRELARRHATNADHPVIGLRHATEERFATPGAFLLEIRHRRRDLHGSYRVTHVLQERSARVGAASRGETRDGFHRGRTDDHFAAGGAAVRIA